MAMAMGIWHFAVKSHIDIKHIYTRLGSSVSNNTARRSLAALAAAGIEHLQKTVEDGMASTGDIPIGLVLDNVQEYERVYEHGSGRRSRMIIGCANTGLFMKNFASGAFNVQDHLERVIASERSEMSIESLMADIDWNHIDNSLALHLVLSLVDFIPKLDHLHVEISHIFRTTLAKHRAPLGKTEIQPLGTNGENEMENSGMYRAVLDFEKQMGIKPEYAEKSLQWIRGNGLVCHSPLSGKDPLTLGF